MINRAPNFTKHLRKRHRAETRFRIYGLLAIGLAALSLAMLLVTLVAEGHSGFLTAEAKLEVTFDPAIVNEQNIDSANYGLLARRAAMEKKLFPGDEASLKTLQTIMSDDAGIQLAQAVKQDPSLIGQTQSFWLPLASRDEMVVKTHFKDKEVLERIPAPHILALIEWQKQGRLHTTFNTLFFERGDSRDPEQAGFLGAIVGSLFTVAACMLLAFPLGVITAIYLEEFAPQNRLIDVLEVNINNLAAVPSIVFGLLGLALYLSLFGMPRSSALAGGMTLALMILPTIVITTRAALKSVPPSVRMAAQALGASPLQTVMHHTLPLSMPGIMTGAILGVARAIGETAPLLMIGMVAFIVDVPGSFTAPATAMPVQIYLWASSPEAGFVEKTSAGILVLLALLMLMNSVAIYIRKRFEVRW